MLSKKILKIKILSLVFLLLPFASWAKTLPPVPVNKDSIFQAEVITVVKDQKSKLDDGTEVEQQDIRLLGLDGKFKNQIVEFNGINGFDLVKKNLYKKGDHVLVAAVYDDKGVAQYYITDYVRTDGIKWLAILFLAALLIVGRWKGVRSLVSLALSFIVIMYFNSL